MRARAPSLISSLIFSVALCSGCGGRDRTAQRRAAETLADIEADSATLPGGEAPGLGDGAVGQPALQLYLVLLPAAGAFQGPEAQQAMWRAVRGEDPRFQDIQRQVTLAGEYPLEITIDYADLPHPQVDMRRVGRLLSELPEATAAQAQRAALAVFIQSRAPVLAGGDHLRLVGSAPLFIAERWGGVVVDLISRRAWTPADLRARLAAPSFGVDQVKLVDQVDPRGGRWILTRGHAKLGLPDLQARGVPEAAADQARGALLAWQDRLLHGQPAAGLRPCEAPKGFYDGPCLEIPPMW